MFIVFDLDGTLAGTSHRVHFLEQEPKDWESFYAACVDDEPIGPIWRLYLSLEKDRTSLEIWTGRPDTYKDVTELWLWNHLMRYDKLRMRKEGDFRSDIEVKSEWLRDSGKPDLVFEDRSRMVQWWRSQGVICCQVAEGNY